MKKGEIYERKSLAFFTKSLNGTYFLWISWMVDVSKKLKNLGIKKDVIFNQYDQNKIKQLHPTLELFMSCLLASVNVVKCLFPGWLMFLTCCYESSIQGGHLLQCLTIFHCSPDVSVRKFFLLLGKKLFLLTVKYLSLMNAKEELSKNEVLVYGFSVFMYLDNARFFLYR